MVDRKIRRGTQKDTFPVHIAKVARKTQTGNAQLMVRVFSFMVRISKGWGGL